MAQDYIEASKVWLRNHRWSVVSATAIVFLIVVVLYSYFGVDRSDCGTDRTCFLRLATDCGDAKLTLTDTRGTASLISHNCTTIKTITELPQMSAPISDYLVGQSMTCQQLQGFYPQSLLSSITSGLALCDGPLRDRLVELRQYTYFNESKGAA